MRRVSKPPRERAESAANPKSPFWQHREPLRCTRVGGDL